MGRSKLNTRFSCWLLGTALFAVLIASPRLTAAAEQKIALVIGNSAYPSSRLRNPVNDAKAMADKLKALGFEVILRTDSNLREMTRSFSQFGQKLTPGSVSLFYYAGHGMQVRGKNFLIPVDAEIENEASVTSEAVDVDQLLNQLGPARLSMVILDACRNNPFERRFRATVSGGLAQIDAPTGTLLAYATAPGKVASDGTGSNGLYTEALLKALEMPGLKVEDVFKQVRINVVKASDGTQTPWESSSLTGEFYFTPDNKPALADEKLKQSEKARAELAKALDDERKRRDKDAELIRQEMEKLRAELLQMRVETASQPTAPTAIATAPAAAPAIQPPSQKVQPVATVPAPQIAASNPPPSVPVASPTPPVQIALVAPATIAPATASNTTGWEQRISLLEKSKGKLTFAKSTAILMDISSAEDITVLVTQDESIRRKTWPKAMAMGVNQEGELVWAVAWNWHRSNFATDTALEHCAKTGGVRCKIVLENDNFNETNFLELAKVLGMKDPQTVRNQYLATLKTPGQTFGMEISAGRAMPTMAFVTVSK